MELKLVKTTGGGDGRPPKCKCGNNGFVRIGHGWTCYNCAMYYPTDFQTLQAAASRFVNYMKDKKNGMEPC